MKEITSLRLFIAILLLTNSISCSSQTITRKYIDSTIQKINPTLKQKGEMFYVLNGIPYEPLELDSVLFQYDLKYLIDIDYLSCAKTNFNHCLNDIALIRFAHHQKTNKKRIILSTAKKILSKSKRDSVVLYVDKEKIENSKANQLLKSFKLKDLMYIDTTTKNNIQLIRIWKSKKE